MSAVDLKIIKLSPNRWREHKELRLKSLQTDPGAWEHTYENVSMYPDQRWSERLENSWNERESLTLFGEIDGKLVGMAGAVWDDRGSKKDVAMIVSVYLLPEFRGQGIARKIVEAVIDRLIEKKRFKKIELWVVDANTEAKELYKKLGFVQVQTIHKELVEKGESVYEAIMEKDIDG